MNSVNLEKSGERVKPVLPLVPPLRRGGGRHDHRREGDGADRRAQGRDRPAASWGWRRSTASRPDSLVFDALTFTLATGGEEYRRSAVETLEGIRRIKAENPGVLTTLGVSNVSFGLAKRRPRGGELGLPLPRGQAGLDLAIVNPKDIRPYPDIADEERTLAEDLIFDRRPDALARLIEHFGQKGAPEKARGGPARRRGREDGRGAHPPADPPPPAGGHRGAHRRGAHAAAPRWRC